MKKSASSADYHFTSTNYPQLCLYLLQSALEKTGKRSLTQPFENEEAKIHGQSWYGRQKVLLTIQLLIKPNYPVSILITAETSNGDITAAKKCIHRLLRVYEILEKNESSEIIQLGLTPSRKLKTGFSRMGLLVYKLTGMENAGTLKL